MLWKRLERSCFCKNSFRWVLRMLRIRNITSSRRVRKLPWVDIWMTKYRITLQGPSSMIKQFLACPRRLSVLNILLFIRACTTFDLFSDISNILPNKTSWCEQISNACRVISAFNHCKSFLVKPESKDERVPDWFSATGLILFARWCLHSDVLQRFEQVHSKVAGVEPWQTNVSNHSRTFHKLEPRSKCITGF